MREAAHLFSTKSMIGSGPSFEGRSVSSLDICSRKSLMYSVGVSCATGATSTHSLPPRREAEGVVSLEEPSASAFFLRRLRLAHGEALQATRTHAKSGPRKQQLQQQKQQQPVKRIARRAKPMKIPYI